MGTLVRRLSWSGRRLVRSTHTHHHNIEANAHFTRYWYEAGMEQVYVHCSRIDKL